MGREDQPEEPPPPSLTPTYGDRPVADYRPRATPRLRSVVGLLAAVLVVVGGVAIRVGGAWLDKRASAEDERHAVPAAEKTVTSYLSSGAADLTSYYASGRRDRAVADVKCGDLVMGGTLGTFTIAGSHPRSRRVRRRDGRPRRRHDRPAVPSGRPGRVEDLAFQVPTLTVSRQRQPSVRDLVP